MISGSIKVYVGAELVVLEAQDPDGNRRGLLPLWSLDLHKKPDNSFTSTMVEV
jgi:hypothetical protein